MIQISAKKCDRPKKPLNQSKMLSDSSHGLLEKSLKIKQEDKFFSRLLSKETSATNSSCRILYYGGASGAVPFTWESQPGTPKHTLSETSLPPLTPPPSCYSTSKSNPMRKNSKPNMLYTIFPRLTPSSRKEHESPTSSLSSSVSSSSSSWYSSSSYSSPSSSMRAKRHGRHCSRSSPTSTLSFGSKRKTSNGFRGCYPMGNMKNALLSIVGYGYGSGQGTA